MSTIIQLPYALDGLEPGIRGRIGNGYLPRDASGHQQAGYLRGCGGLYAYAQMHATDAGAVR